jgi:hypothetical protein
MAKPARCRIATIVASWPDCYSVRGRLHRVPNHRVCCAFHTSDRPSRCHLAGHPVVDANEAVARLLRQIPDESNDPLASLPCRQEQCMKPLVALRNENERLVGVLATERDLLEDALPVLLIHIDGGHRHP